MNILNLLQIRPLIIIVALGIGLIFMIAIAISIFSPQEPATTQSTPLPRTPDKRGVPLVIPNIDINQQPALLNYSQIVIGETSDNIIEKLPGLLSSETLENGNKQYEFSSPYSSRNNLVETENDKAIFKRVISITTNDYQTPNINTYLQAYGDPEFEFTGSKRYGIYAKILVYPSKGFSLTYNPFTGEVFEIQSFKSVSLDEYKSRWGEDINEEPEPEIDNNKVY